MRLHHSIQLCSTLTRPHVREASFSYMSRTMTGCSAAGVQPLPPGPTCARGAGFRSSVYGVSCRRDDGWRDGRDRGIVGDILGRRLLDDQRNDGNRCRHACLGFLSPHCPIHVCLLNAHERRQDLHAMVPMPAVVVRVRAASDIRTGRWRMNEQQRAWVAAPTSRSCCSG